MKSFLPNVAYFTILATFIFISTIVYGQKEFSKLTSSTDSTFGYSNLNPLKLKKGNQGKSIDNTYKFLSGLKTLDNQTLTLLFRATTDNPAYKEPSIKINNRFTGMPISGKLGFLDKYVFLTSSTKDTVTLFVDIYNKGDLFLPVGLKYEQK
ncbi:MAG: hypothetical protein ABIS01_04115 [Ferruginibacter sp.]